ncbi:MAG: DUF721 domain-containing protein [Rhodothalassiaceae bacterium]
MRPQRLADLTAAAAGRSLSRMGFARTEVISQWRQIVGPDLAERCHPVKLSFPRNHAGGGTLHLRVAPGSAPEIQHRLPLILERINRYFGYGAVKRAAIEQGPLPLRRVASPPASQPDPAALNALAEQTAKVRDASLQAALRRLGRQVAPRRP